MDEYFVSNNITWVPTKDSQQNLSETKTGKLRTMAKKLILEWYEDLRAELLRQGFQQSIHDQCLFSRTKNGYTTYLATWVDDVVVISNDPKIDDLLTSLKKHNFDIQTFENLDWYNQSTIDISKNDRGSDKCKHIAITHNFLQENEGKTIDLLKIPTKDNIADLFTKPLPRRQFETLRDRLFGLAKNPFSTATRMREEASTLHQGYFVFSL